VGIAPSVNFLTEGKELHPRARGHRTYAARTIATAPRKRRRCHFVRLAIIGA